MGYHPPRTRTVKRRDETGWSLSHRRNHFFRFPSFPDSVWERACRCDSVAQSAPGIGLKQRIPSDQPYMHGQVTPVLQIDEEGGGEPVSRGGLKRGEEVEGRQESHEDTAGVDFTQRRDARNGGRQGNGIARTRALPNGVWELGRSRPHVWPW